MRYRDSARLSTVLFAAVLPCFLLIPIAAGPVHETAGITVLTSTSNPAFILAVGVVVSAAAGAVLPHFMRRNRTLTRLILALSGLGCLLAMLFQPPVSLGPVTYEAGYWLTAVLFSVTAFVATYMLGKLSK